MTILRGQNFIDANKAALKLLKMLSKKEIFEIHPSQISPEYQPDGRRSDEKADEMIAKCYENGVNRFDWVHCTLDKEEFWLEITLNKIVVNGEELIYVIWKDLKDRKKLEDDLHHKNKVLVENNIFIKKINTILKDKSSDDLIESLLLLDEYKKVIDESSIVSKTDLNGIITYANDIFCAYSGYSREELIGQNHNIIRHPDNDETFYKDMWDTISNKKIFKGIIKNKKKDGSTYIVDSTIMPIIDKNNNIVEYIALRHDITSVYEKDEIINKQFTDMLTSLPNRQKLLSDVDILLQPHLAIMNVDRFSDINESYGLDIADNILKEIAQELRLFQSDNLNIYRIGGDIFALLACADFSVDDLHKVCINLTEHFDKKVFNIEDNSLEISFTIGIAPHSNKILSHAEMAFSNAKQKNKQIIIYDEKMDIFKRVKENIQLTQDIKNALKNDNILLFGQKIVNNKSKEVKYETLMRMRKEDGKILSPYFFLDQAKKARLYPMMTKVMIEKACDYFQGRNTIFSLNLTVQDIMNQDTLEYLITKLEKTSLAKWVILEIVESEGIEIFNEVSEFINRFKKLGCKIAIDDFGTGYSNFEYIIKLNVDILKIDGSLIKNIHKDKNIYKVVSTIVSFAKSLNIEVVAEFVHCEEVFDIVNELGIDYSQGYFLHEPEHLISK